MDQNKLIAAIRDLADNENVRLIAIEKKLKMPQNSLSGMLNERRPFPKKWQKKLIQYLKDRKASKKKIG